MKGKPRSNKPPANSFTERVRYPALLPPRPRLSNTAASDAEEWQRIYYDAEPSRAARAFSFRLSEPFFPEDPEHYASVVTNDLSALKMELSAGRLDPVGAYLKARRSELQRQLKRFPELLSTEDRKAKAVTCSLLSYVNFCLEGDARLVGDIKGFALECVGLEAELEDIQIVPHLAGDSGRLVRRYYEFAGARHDYHRIIIERAFPKAAGSNPALKEGTRKTLQERAQEGGNRSQFKDHERDLWLVLIWPIATEYRWNYSDVERARRIRFNEIPPQRLQAADLERIAGSASNRLMDISSPAEQEWILSQMQVLEADRKNVSARCDYLGLSALKARVGRPSKLQENGGYVPKMIELALSIRA